jgi:tetratricopeptide (TPR) repeat protein
MNAISLRRSKSWRKAARLLPKNALVWNYLGLAYHGQQLPEPAAKAYRTALAHDHKLSAIRYNLGCLYLEQNQLPAAIDEFRSYSLLQPARSTDGSASAQRCFALTGWMSGKGLSLCPRAPEPESRGLKWSGNDSNAASPMAGCPQPLQPRGPARATLSAGPS